MGYSLGTPWGLARSERESSPQISATGSVSCSSALHRTERDCSVELKLGRLGDSTESGVSAMEPSFSSGSSKRARAPTSGGQVVSCLVDGCNSDLSKCREYHRRHKVCEIHSKTPIVTIAGQERRFCQQCSRFHSLDEFDEGKRSCRKRLDGHNRRRRKPQPEPVSVTAGRFLGCHHRGSGFPPMGGPEVFLTSSVVNSALPPFTTTPSQLYFGGGREPPFHSWQSCKGEKQISFSAAGTDPGGHSQEAFSDRALSLLSSPLAESETRETGLTHMVEPHLTHHPMVSNLHCYGPGMEGCDPIGGAAATAALSDSGGGDGDANFQCQGVFPDGSSASGSHHGISFSWE